MVRPWWNWGKYKIMGILWVVFTVKIVEITPALKFHWFFLSTCLLLSILGVILKTITLDWATLKQSRKFPVKTFQSVKGQWSWASWWKFLWPQQNLNSWLCELKNGLGHRKKEEKRWILDKQLHFERSWEIPNPCSALMSFGMSKNRAQWICF